MSSQVETTPNPENVDQKAVSADTAEQAVLSSPPPDAPALEAEAATETTAAVAEPQEKVVAETAEAEAPAAPKSKAEAEEPAEEVAVEATAKAPPDGTAAEKAAPKTDGESDTGQTTATADTDTAAADTDTAAADTDTAAADTDTAFVAALSEAMNESLKDAAKAKDSAAVKEEGAAAEPAAADSTKTKAEESKAEESKAKETKAEAAADTQDTVSKKADKPGKTSAGTNAPAKGEAISGLSPLKASIDDEPGDTMTLLERAKEGKQAVKGQVIGWNKGGYHVAIGKIAAFCPVSQIEIGNPRSPKRYLDKSFEFRVIEIQNGGRRVVISRSEALKAERETRAALVRERLKPGTKLEGRVSSLTTFGAFVDLGGGIEGLVHVSELSRQRVEHPKEMLKVGDQVKVSVLKIEKGGERVSLSMKRLEADPWKAISERMPVGSQFSGKVLRKTDFGIFVQVEAGIEGLVHLSRLPLGVTMQDDSLEIGLEVHGWIHEVDGRRRRLSLSLREVSSSNPWKGIHDRFPVGDVITGKVERLANFGVFIELEPGLTGLLPFSTLPGGRINNPRRQYFPGKDVQVRVLSIDTDKRRISLGTEASKAEGSPQDYKEYVKTQNTGGAGLSAMAAAFAKLQG